MFEMKNIMTKEDGEKIARDVLDAVNPMCFNYEEAARSAITDDALTAINVLRLFDAVMAEMVAFDFCDARNEESHKMAREMKRQNLLNYAPARDDFEKGFGEGVCRGHRTLQQNTVRFLVALLNASNEAEANSDIQKRLDVADGFYLYFI